MQVGAKVLDFRATGREIRASGQAAPWFRIKRLLTKVMLSQSVNLLTLFLCRLSPLSGLLVVCAHAFGSN